MTCLCTHPVADHPGGECVHRARGCHEFRLDPESPAAWLRGPDGVAWSKLRSETGPLGAATTMRRDGVVDPAWDPCGRGPSTPEETATEGAA